MTAATENSLPLLFSGTNPRAQIALCRLFEKWGCEYGIIDWARDDVIRHTVYARRILARRHTDQLTMEDLGRCLDEVRTLYPDRTLQIMPTSEYVNRFLFKHRHVLRERYGTVTPLCDEDVYLRVSDKFTSQSLFRDHGIDVPRWADHQAAIGLPVVAKPRREFSMDGRKIYPYLIYNRHQLDEFAARESPEDYFFQEFVEGKSYYVLYHFSRHGDWLYRVQRNLLQQANGKSIIAAVLDDAVPKEIVERTAEIFRNIGFTGIVMVEFIARGGEYVYIESNPRYWGPFQLCVDVCNDMARRILSDLGVDVSISAQRNRAPRRGSYLWLGGMVESILHWGRVRVYPGALSELIWSLPLYLANDVYLRRDSWRVYPGQAAGYVMRRLREAHP